MSKEQQKFHGFNSSAAKKGSVLEQVLKRSIKQSENRSNTLSNNRFLCTSTPKSKSGNMEQYFNNEFNTVINYAMDYDSGYISHNQESNSDCSAESTSTNAAYPFFSINPFYISEDTLLERPEDNKFVGNVQEPCDLSSDSNSIVPASVETVKTQFSGFGNESDLSAEIYTVDEIVYKEENFKNDNEFENSLIEVNDSLLSQNTNQTLTINDSLLVTNVSISTNMKNLILEEEKVSTSKENSTMMENIPVCTPAKQYNCSVNSDFSPDLFDDCDEKKKSLPLNYIADEKYIIKKDHKLLKRVHSGLNGVPPPPSVTIVQISVNDMLNKIEKNKEYFWTENCDTKMNTSLNSSLENEEFKSLLITVENTNKFLYKRWPQVLEDRFHGLHYNRSKLSEEFELLCDKFAQRCIGAETQSTCTVFENNYISPSKRKALKQRWSVKSPSRRLSHLARRRITFSSANLQGGSSSGIANGNRTRQILVDAKKLELLRRKSPRKTPKKTPSKSPRSKTRTPSSSAKKKLALRFRKLTGEFEVPNSTAPSSENNSIVMSKRALFQSPERTQHFLPSTSNTSVIETSSRKITLKRALFASPRKISPKKQSPFKKRSPFKKSPFKLFDNDKKRKRTESEDERCLKIPRSMSCTLEIRPSTSEMKTLNRTKSEILNKSTNELSEVHKKKLQWAVYEALKSQNITANHAQFKVFASILARVTRKFLPNLNSNMPRPEGGTSERMLRIARHHVYAVVKGKSVDEIINEYLKNRKKLQKPQGYVAVEDFNKSKESDLNKENVNVVKSSTKSGSNRKNVLSENQNIINENRVDRIRKVINFGDDENR